MLLSSGAVVGGGTLIAGQGNSPRPTYLLTPPPPKPMRAPTGLFEPQSEVDSLSGFRTPRDGSGTRMVGQGPTGRIRVSRANIGHAGRIRALEENQGPVGENQDPGERIRAFGPVAPAGRIGNPQDRSRLHKTNQGPAG